MRRLQLKAFVVRSFRDMDIGDGANHLSGLFIKTWYGNGGTIEDITWENLRVKGKVGVRDYTARLWLRCAQSLRVCLSDCCCCPL